MSRHDAYFAPLPSLNSATWRGLAFHWSCVYRTSTCWVGWPSSCSPRAIVFPRTTSPRRRPTCWRPETERPEDTTRSPRPFANSPTLSRSSSAQCIGGTFRCGWEGEPKRFGASVHVRRRLPPPPFREDEERGREDRQEPPRGRDRHRGPEQGVQDPAHRAGEDHRDPRQDEHLARTQERDRDQEAEPEQVREQDPAAERRAVRDLVHAPRGPPRHADS